MIIITGPDADLCRQVTLGIKRTDGPVMWDYDYEVPREGEAVRADLNYLVKYVHADHTKLVKEGFEHGLTAEDPALYMLGMALAAQGSLVVLCGIPTREDTRTSTFCGLIPAVPIITAGPLSIEYILDAWRAERDRVEKTIQYNSAGGRPQDPIMLIGEANQEMGKITRRAFISHTGCSLFLHAALMANPHNRYYLTNAVKAPGKMNELWLREEIEHVLPSRIIAMGQEAARMVSALKFEHTRTYHPQYWKRFKHRDHAELVALLR